MDSPTFPLSKLKSWKGLFTPTTRQTFKTGWLEEKWELKRARVLVCWDECGRETYRGWIPEEVEGYGWIKIEGSEFVADDRYMPEYHINEPSTGVPGF